MADNKNEKFIYAGVAAVVIVLLMCYTGQPIKFLQDNHILACPGCTAGGSGGGGSGGGSGGNATWDGNCYGLVGLDVKDRCCPEFPCPTCVLNRQSMTCSGTCPVPPMWTGWTGTCTLKTMIYGMDCVCEYAPPQGSYVAR